MSNVRYLFNGFPPLPPPSPEGRTVDCPHCRGLCANTESPDFISVVGCGGSVTESTSAVEQQITARIQAARRRTEDMRRQRAELAAARKVGLARRHAAKLRHLKDTERADARLEESSDAED